MTRQRRGRLWYPGFLLLVIVIVLVGTIGTLGMHFQASPAPLWIALWCSALVAGLMVGLRVRLVAGFAGMLVCFAFFFLWRVTITPTNDRDWQPDVAELASGSIDPADPSRITIENVRNFDWITAAEFQPR